MNMFNKDTTNHHINLESEIGKLLSPEIKATAPPDYEEMAPPKGLTRSSLKVWYKRHIGHLPEEWSTGVTVRVDKNLINFFSKRYLGFTDPNPIERTVSEMTAAVDALEFDDDSMINAIQMSSDQKVARLRHRATMLTERAKQMHDEADTLEGEAADAIYHIKTVSATLKLSEDILRAHAHIEPKRES